MLSSLGWIDPGNNDLFSQFGRLAAQWREEEITHPSQMEQCLFAGLPLRNFNPNTDEMQLAAH